MITDLASDKACSSYIQEIEGNHQMMVKRTDEIISLQQQKEKMEKKQDELSIKLNTSMSCLKEIDEEITKVKLTIEPIKNSDALLTEKKKEITNAQKQLSDIQAKIQYDDDIDVVENYLNIIKPYIDLI